VAYFDYHPVLGLQCPMGHCQFDGYDIDIARVYEMIRSDIDFTSPVESRDCAMSHERSFSYIATPDGGDMIWHELCESGAIS
jgi:hypothetical protein